MLQLGDAPHAGYSRHNTKVVVQWGPHTAGAEFVPNKNLQVYHVHQPQNGGVVLGTFLSRQYSLGREKSANDHHHHHSIRIL